MGGDLNLTIYDMEARVLNSRHDPLVEYLRHMFHMLNLIDGLQFQMYPTYRNVMVIHSGISKHVNRFFSSITSVGFMGRFRSLTYNFCLSNKYPIILQTKVKSSKVKYTLKFKHSWLLEEDFSSLI